MTRPSMISPAERAPLARRNRRLMLVCVGVVAFMVAGSFASVPLYRLFCQVTGFGGTPLRADQAPKSVLEREVIVRFNADTDPSLPWAFRPAQREVKVKLGEQALVFYTARNLGHEPITGNATFNVTPLKVGGHFDKVECFCFKEQTLQPGQSAELPVSFFVDPSLANDANLDDIKVITLSYTFFRARKPETPRVSAAPGQARPLN